MHPHEIEQMVDRGHRRELRDGVRRGVHEYPQVDEGIELRSAEARLTRLLPFTEADARATPHGDAMAMLTAKVAAACHGAATRSAARNAARDATRGAARRACRAAQPP